MGTPCRIATLPHCFSIESAILTVPPQGATGRHESGPSRLLLRFAKCKKYLSWSKTRIRCIVSKKAKTGRVAVSIKTVAGTSRAKYVKVRRWTRRADYVHLAAA